MSKELEYEVINFVNLLHKDCMNLMECLKKQGEDNKPILYLGKHYKKVILPYEEYQKMYIRLEQIDNAEPNEALKCLEALEQDIKDRVILAEDRQLKLCAVIKQALQKAQEPKKYLKWEDLEFEHTPKYIDVKMSGNKYKLVAGYNVAGKNLAILRDGKKEYYFLEYDKQFFNDLHLEMVE